ncbi:hypothetical protein [Hansschlegelia sp.]|uniref:hypothetical protein n=1 Tax=Hansschlegelia sp. TaxID=2041892 RepID=UPI002C0253E2|nr:hypothetical protein [Hansschlegelia sp.]HVI28874.1 hypothetical protein [Hansschlegelia sp.]
MVGRVTTIPGVSAPALGGKRIVMTEADKLIARLPGLLHYFDPAVLDAYGAGKCRASGRPIRSFPPAGSAAGTLPTPTRVAVDAAFNNKPTISFPTGDGDIRIGPRTVTPSFAIVMVASLAAAANASGAGFAQLLTTANANVLGVTWQNVATASFRADNLAGGSDYIGVPSASVPLDTKAIWVFSYDDDARTAIAWIANVTPLTRTGITTPALVAPSMTWNIGGSGGNSTANGWRGKIAKALIFGREMHSDTYRPYLDDAVAALKAEFAIA